MNLRHLRYFLVIVSTGSLRRSSEALYVTQSALSRAIVELERELGCTLLERSRSGVSPTKAGLALLGKARHIVADVDALRAEVLESRNLPFGEVRLAMPIGVRDRLIRPLVRCLRKDYPEIRLDIADGNAHENRTAVLEGRADIAVIQESERGLPLSYRRLYDDPLCLVGPRNVGLSLSKVLDPGILAEHPLLLVRSPNQIRWSVDAALRKLGIRAKPAIEANSSLLLLDLVHDGHGFTVLPASLISEAVRGRALSAARLDSLKVTWVAAWPKGKVLANPVRIALDVLLAIA